MQRATGSGGGWSFTAYSNPEGFSETVVQSFASAGMSIGMENKGTYPGNAKNFMIEQRNQDSDYIEKAHIALLDCHGNVSGPDLEYVPSIKSKYSWYQWGDEGLLQWVMIQGCDCLGFPVFPDGSPAPYYPSVDRWDGAFMGISGMLGYRSASYYQKFLISPNVLADYNLPLHTLSLPGDTAGVLVNALAAGETFFDAWTHAADFLHRSLDVQAEVAVFASADAALNDSFRSFFPERKIGLAQSSVRYRRVGSGPAPVFHYCDRVDLNGNPLCTAVVRKEFKEFKTVKFFEREQFTSGKFEERTLPVFAYSLDERIVGFLRGIFKGLNTLDFDPLSILGNKDILVSSDSFGARFGLIGKTVSIRQGELDSLALSQNLQEQFISRFQGGALVADEVEFGALTSSLHKISIEVDGQKYGMTSSPSVSVRRTRIGQEVQFELPDRISQLTQQRRLPDMAKALELVEQRLPTWVQTVDLLRSEIVYTRLGSRLNGILLPSIRFDVILKGAEKTVTACLML